jgi:hypothetical protein
MLPSNTISILLLNSPWMLMGAHYDHLRHQQCQDLLQGFSRTAYGLLCAGSWHSNAGGTLPVNLLLLLLRCRSITCVLAENMVLPNACCKQLFICYICCAAGRWPQRC